ncbi:MAG TPA: hypothetical protein VHO70_01500 [Chitinispirillaceae bacterium]|nr:hypothetical protein [Chitinispirillaceae bacterium]
MADSVARTFFPSLLSKLEKKRQDVAGSPLRMAQISVLLSMRFNNKPLFESIEVFYSEEYKKAISDNLNPSELEKINKFRPATQEEANLLFSDIFAREESERYTTQNSTDS